MSLLAVRTLVSSRIPQLDAHVAFPALLLVLNVGAALVSASARDYKRAAYWLASAVCIGMVAF